MKHSKIILVTLSVILAGVVGCFISKVHYDSYFCNAQKLKEKYYGFPETKVADVSEAQCLQYIDKNGASRGIWMKPFVTNPGFGGGTTPEDVNLLLQNNYSPIVWKKYENEQTDLSFKIPSTWEINSQENGDIIISVFSSKQQAEQHDIGDLVSIRSVRTETSAEQTVMEEIAKIKKSSGGTAIEDNPNAYLFLGPKALRVLTVSSIPKIGPGWMPSGKTIFIVAENEYIELDIPGTDDLFQRSVYDAFLTSLRLK